jgi:hypothetical protein
VDSGQVEIAVALDSLVEFAAMPHAPSQSRSHRRCWTEE